MKKVIFFNILIVALLLGCEDVLQKGDEIVRGLDAAAGGTQAVLESPAGQQCPEHQRNGEQEVADRCVRQVAASTGAATPLSCGTKRSTSGTPAAYGSAV